MTLKSLIAVTAAVAGLSIAACSKPAEETKAGAEVAATSAAAAAAGSATQAAEAAGAPNPGVDAPMTPAENVPH